MDRYPTVPDSRFRAAIRCKGVLAASAAVVNATPVSEYVQVAGSARVRARIKTSGAGTLDLTFGFFVNDVFTAYATGNPAQVAVSAATEAKIESDTYGESWCKVTFTPSANGTVTFCDVSQL